MQKNLDLRTNKQGKFVLGLGVILIIIILFIIFGKSVWDEQTEILKELQTRGLEDESFVINKEKIKCFDDCLELNKIFFKVDVEFTSKECWCKDQNLNETIQIW